MKSFAWVLALMVVVLSVVFTVYLNENDRLEKDAKATYLKGGEFTLSNEGESFSLSSLAGKPLILYFGFTFCPDVCPVGLATIRDALNSSHELSTLPAVFVTLDPERDSRQKLKEYTGFFHSNIIGLTGSIDEIQTVAKRYGTYFRKSSKGEDSKDYLVDHTAYFYLINAEGELIRVLDHNASAQEISDLLLKML